MIHRFTPGRIVFSLLFFALSGIALAQPTPGIASHSTATSAKVLPFVSPIFGDNMVLQRGKVNTIWGWSEPGDNVQVKIGEATASGVAGADHRWQVAIQPPPVGGPYTIKITGHQTVELQNVLVGDVWLCGGQSNMQLSLRDTRTGPEDAKAANDSEIRFFNVAPHTAYHPVDVAEGEWKVLSPETAGRVSAVGFYFARKIRQEIHVPIGLVVDALGGTPAEAWTSAAALHPL
ncbi:MAG: sialate O-acetylesterase, partial [Terracidiphilus sp.]